MTLNKGHQWGPFLIKRMAVASFVDNTNFAIIKNNINKRIHIYLNPAALLFYFFYKYLSNIKFLRILPCQIFLLS